VLYPIDELKRVGLAVESTTDMGLQVGREIRFYEEASEFIAPFFR